MRKLKFESTEVEVGTVLRGLSDKELLREVESRDLDALDYGSSDRIDLTDACDELRWKKPLEALRRIEIADPRLDGLGDAVARHFGARP